MTIKIVNSSNRLSVPKKPSHSFDLVGILSLNIQVYWARIFRFKIGSTVIYERH